MGSTDTSKDRTELVFVIDASGSMYGLEADTVGGINATLEENRKVEGDVRVSLVTFDSRSTVVLDRVKIEHVSPLGEEDYHVGGCTALLDALGGAIAYHTKVQKILPKGHRADHVIFVVITDGMENASHTFDYRSVKRTIEKRRKKGWEFLFLGANIDAAAEADRLGIAQNRASRYVNDAAGMQVAYAAVSAATVQTRNCGRPNDDWARNAEADARRRA